MTALEDTLPYRIGWSRRFLVLVCILLAPVLALVVALLFLAHFARIYLAARCAPEWSMARKAVSLRGALLGFMAGLRYRITVEGLDKISADRGVLFLSNHPSLLDPFILYSCLDGLYPRFIGDENQFTSVILRWVRNATEVIAIPDYTIAGPKARAGLLQGLGEASRSLEAGRHVAMYPAGYMQRFFQEKLGNTSGVSRILREVPQARVVAVSVRGMWGSSFSRAAHGGEKPVFMQMLIMGMKILAANLIFFVPRRDVLIKFTEFEDCTLKTATSDAESTGSAVERRALTARLEAYFNAAQLPAMAVPYFFGK